MVFIEIVEFWSLLLISNVSPDSLNRGEIKAE